MGFLTAKVCPSWLKKEATSSRGASQVASYMIGGFNMIYHDLDW